MTDPRPLPARSSGPATTMPVGAPGPDAPHSRHLRVVANPAATPAQRRRLVRILLAGGVAVSIAVVFALAYLHVVAAQYQLRLNKLSGQAAAEQVTYQRLRLQVAQLESPGHIISTAVGKLGMQQPSSVTYLTPSVPPATSGSGAPASAGHVPASASGGSAVAGDADWPQIKSQLAGSP